MHKETEILLKIIPNAELRMPMESKTGRPAAHSKSIPIDFGLNTPEHAMANSESNDLDLARRLARRDDSALEEVIALYELDLRRLIGSLTAWDRDLDDILQDCFLKAWLKAGSFRGESSLKTWLSRIAISLCRNRKRSWSRWIRRLTELWERSEQSPDSPSEHKGLQGTDGERWTLIQNAMSQLRYPDREILVLHYVENLSAEEGAERLGVNMNAFHVRLHRARERLKKMVNPNDK